MKALRRLGFALWLALALVAGQQAVALHDLGHASEILQQPEGSKPGPSKCGAHFACSLLASAVGAGALVAAIVVATPPRAGSLRERPAPQPLRLAFRSRAPPTLL